MSNCPEYTDDLEDDILLRLEDPVLEISELEPAATSMALTLPTTDLASLYYNGGEG